MKAPIKELAELEKLLKEAREFMTSGAFEKAEEKIRSAFSKDQKFIPAYELMAVLCEKRDQPGDAAQWRARAKSVQTETWERQVEAEARGRHEVLGEAVRHEIP